MLKISKYQHSKLKPSNSGIEATFDLDGIEQVWKNRWNLKGQPSIPWSFTCNGCSKGGVQNGYTFSRMLWLPKQ